MAGMAGRCADVVAAMNGRSTWVDWLAAIVIGLVLGAIAGVGF